MAVWLSATFKILDATCCCSLLDCQRDRHGPDARAVPARSSVCGPAVGVPVNMPSRAQPTGQLACLADATTSAASVRRGSTSRAQPSVPECISAVESPSTGRSAAPQRNTPDSPRHTTSGTAFTSPDVVRNGESAFQHLPKSWHSRHSQHKLPCTQKTSFEDDHVLHTLDATWRGLDAVGRMHSEDDSSPNRKQQSGQHFQHVRASAWSRVNKTALSLDSSGTCSSRSSVQSFSAALDMQQVVQRQHVTAELTARLQVDVQELRNQVRHKQVLTAGSV